MRVPHQRLQPGPLRAREPAQAGDRERAVLVEQRDDVGDRRQRDEVEVRGDVDAERLRELAHDAGAAELRERIVGRARRDDRAVRQRLAGPVMVGDDHLEPARLRGRHLLDGGDAAVDGEQERAALVGEPRDRVPRDAVAFLEAARQVPLDLGAERAQGENGERGRADPVDVVVAVDADAPSLRDRGADPLDRDSHVAEQEGIVRLELPDDERTRRVDVAEAPPNEDGCHRLAHLERLREGLRLRIRARLDRPGTVAHGQSTVRVGRTASSEQASGAASDSRDDLHPEQDHAGEGAERDDRDRRVDRHLLERVLRHPGADEPDRDDYDTHHRVRAPVHGARLAGPESTLALRVPELEAAPRGREVGVDLSLDGGQLAEREDLVVEPPFRIAAVTGRARRARRKPRSRGTA